MTVPAPRGNAEDATVLGLVLDAVKDVKEEVVRIGGRLDSLDQRYVPRAEYEARHTDMRARLDAEHRERKTLEEKLTAARRYALTTSIAGLVAVVSLLALILSNVH